MGLSGPCLCCVRPDFILFMTHAKKPWFLASFQPLAAENPLLGPGLLDCVAAMNVHDDERDDILVIVDAQKFHFCTQFARSADAGSPFVLRRENRWTAPLTISIDSGCRRDLCYAARQRFPAFPSIRQQPVGSRLMQCTAR